MLLPILALVAWTAILWVWLYATRLPALRRAHIDPRRLKRKADLDALPVSVQQIADNYNHLHEQPTLFYAVALVSHLLPLHDPMQKGLAWSYVGLRVVHSLVQGTVNFVPLRFAVFVLASLTLFGLLGRATMAALGPA